MNRSDLQKLSSIRLRESQKLLAANEFSGAYYLAGYAVECALKARFAKATKRFDFPTGKNPFIHKLTELAKLADLDTELQAEMKVNPRFASGWDLVCKWSEQSRYGVWTRDEAQALLDAIGRRKDGVLPWIKQRW